MTRRLHIDDLGAIAVPEQPALHPGGREVAYVLREEDVDADRVTRSIWRVATDGGASRRLTRGPGDSAPEWSPDGERLAFLRESDGASQLWVLPAAGGEPEQLTTLTLGAGHPVWSPDGTRLAFAAPVDLHASRGEDGDGRARRAAAPVVAERLDYQADGSGYLRGMRLHLHVVELASGATRQATRGDWHAGRPAWSPDGTRLAYAAATAPDTDLDHRAAVWTVDATRDGEPQLVGFADGVADTVTWTSDAAALLVVGSVDGAIGQAGLFRLPLDGASEVAAADLTDLTAQLDRNVMSGGPGYPGAVPQLVDGGAGVVFCVRDRGCTHAYRVTLDGGAPQLVLGGADRVVSGLSVAGGAAVACVSTATSFGELVLIDGAGTERVLTEHGAAFADVAWFARESREFVSADGTQVQGWLVRDPERPGPLPLLLDIHGGPHNAWNGAADATHLYHQELAALGWAVLLVNPRASDGYGRDFFTASLGAWGESDAQDVLGAIDRLVEEGVADPARLAVTGYSYGGYLTCYLTSRDDRFAAAVAGGVVSDLVSDSGTSDLGHLIAQDELHALPWSDADRLARMSPMTKVVDVRTPTLVLQGADDVRCPVGQAQQWFSALRERGVPTRLVLYPGASHLFVLDGRPSHRVDYNRRVLAWVEQYASSAAGPRAAVMDAAHWSRRLAELAARHRVPGAQLGILRVGRDGREDDLVELATGVLNTETGAPATPAAIFQIGSITKVWTATVIMRLIEAGKLELDAPVIEVLPELHLSDPDVTKQVTVRHLLTHTSGIDGDVFTDTGRGDDCLARYVELLADAAQNHPIGVTWSYCNAGFSLLGRVIEKVTDLTWDAAMREWLFAPLGLTATTTLPEEALLHAAAVGHVVEPGADPVLAPVWALPRSLGPAGLVTAPARDVLAFARLHLTGGLAADGTRLLTAANAAAMADEQAELPDKYSLGDSWGLGWIRFGWSGHRLIGHDGNTIGQSAFLRLLPEQGLAVTLLTNGGNARDLYEDLYRELFAELAGVEMPRPLAPPRTPFEGDLDGWTGTYERESVRTEVFADDDGPWLRTTVQGPIAELVGDPVDEFPLVAVAQRLWVVRSPETETWMPVTFYALPTGERYVHHGARATPKVS